MKKRITNSVFFIILIVALIIPGMVMTPSFLNKHHLRSTKDSVYDGLDQEKPDSLDVLIIGDSESYTSISPMMLWKEYGITSYAAGQPGARIGETRDVLKYALKKQQPKMVLLETNNLFRFQSDCRKRDSDLAEMSYQVFPFLKHHNFWNNKVNYLCNKGRHAYKGFGVSGKVKSYNGKIEGSIVTGNQITGESIKCLEKIREACDQAGARLVLYSAPSPKCYPEKKLAYLKKFAKEQGLTYYDLNKESKLMGIDWNVDTRDSGDHLNTAGAVKTTKYVGKLLEENYDLPDHSKDPEIASSWNKLYEKYSRAEANALKKIEAMKTPVIVNDEI
ncbi:MAG TPA: hypothetical protein DCP96_01895 [Lachnospiraceae bacterium]|jgi:hypothetical protein|nr:hypothetical protein [Lachnospiraceae bacterium]HBE08573.1 hypothetical protein [Lachnospiraceae bacterium]